MKVLPEEFTKNGLPYKLIKREGKVALYDVDLSGSYEVVIIYKRHTKTGIAEYISNNDQFGLDMSKAIVKEKDALEYYDKLVSYFKNLKKQPTSPIDEKDLAEGVVEELDEER